MPPAKYINMSIEPESRKALVLLSLDLSKEFGRRVSLSEALALAVGAIYAAEVEIKDPRAEAAALAQSPNVPLRLPSAQANYTWMQT